MERRRDRRWFALYLIYNMRNRMFHEAVHDDPLLEFLAEDIADVADRVLRAVLDEVVPKDPDCASMEELMRSYEQ